MTKEQRHNLPEIGAKTPEPVQSGPLRVPACLQELCDALTPLLLEGETASAAAARLYAEPAKRQAMAPGLRIYGQGARQRRHQIFDRIFPHCRGVVEKRLGKSAWTALLGQYYDAYPGRSWRPHDNASHFPLFLATPPGALPPWLTALADFEWWSWRTYRARPAPEPPVDGWLRIPATTVLRRYAHDVLGWLEDAKDAEPLLVDSYVVFFLDKQMQARRDRASPLEVQILERAAVGVRPEELYRQLPTADADERDLLFQTIEDLQNSGLLTLPFC